MSEPARDFIVIFSPSGAVVESDPLKVARYKDRPNVLHNPELLRVKGVDTRLWRLHEGRAVPAHELPAVLAAARAEIPPVVHPIPVARSNPFPVLPPSLALKGVSPIPLILSAVLGGVMGGLITCAVHAWRLFP